MKGLAPWMMTQPGLWVSRSPCCPTTLSPSILSLVVTLTTLGTLEKAAGQKRELSPLPQPCSWFAIALRQTPRSQLDLEFVSMNSLCRSMSSTSFSMHFGLRGSSFPTVATEWLDFTGLSFSDTSTPQDYMYTQQKTSSRPSLSNVFLKHSKHSMR